MKTPIEPFGAGVIPTLNPSEHTLYPFQKKFGLLFSLKTCKGSHKTEQLYLKKQNIPQLPQIIP